MSYGIIDLSWVKQASEEKPVYICALCPSSGPDSVLFQVTDPKLLEFVGPDTRRFMCPNCGNMWDDSDPMIRRQERITTVVPQDNKPNTPIISAVASKNKDSLKGTAQSKIEQVNFDLDAADLDDLRNQGFQLDKEVVKSSVSGRIVRKEHNIKK